MDIIQRIHSAYPEMTKKQKSIADCLLESPEDIAYITLAQLSQKTSSSGADPAALLSEGGLLQLFGDEERLP